MSEPPILIGGRVELRPAVGGDAAARLALGQDTEIVRMFGGDTRNLKPFTLEGAAAWCARLAAHPHAWVIEEKGRLIGEARLDRLDPHDRRASLAVGIYDPARLGKGLGTETVRLVLAYAFEDLGLHRIGIRVLAFNTRAIRCYAKCGFVIEGREREAALVGGERYDDVIMGLLAREYRS